MKANASIAGFGLRTPHIEDVLTTLPEAGYLEVHSENYFAKGGKSKKQLNEIAKHYPLSFHGVALSLGSHEKPDASHLAMLKNLVDTYNPALVSEHIAWSINEKAYLNDLLPLPYTQEAADILCRNIQIVQETLGRKILIENPSAYLKFKYDDMMSEGTFIKHVINKTGCGLLLDVNNVYVSCQNMGTDAYKHLNEMPFEHVEEIHLAGHAVQTTEKGTLRIDTHSDVVDNAVWELYTHTLNHTGQVPTLIEWDDEIPPLATLQKEANKATALLENITIPQKVSAHA